MFAKPVNASSPAGLWGCLIAASSTLLHLLANFLFDGSHSIVRPTTILNLVGVATLVNFAALTLCLIAGQVKAQQLQLAHYGIVVCLMNAALSVWWLCWMATHM